MSMACLHATRHAIGAFHHGLAFARLSLQFVLAGKPSRAYFLKPMERTWLANRQDTLTAAFERKYGHQSKWWGESPGLFWQCFPFAMRWVRKSWQVLSMSFIACAAHSHHVWLLLHSGARQNWLPVVHAAEHCSACWGLFCLARVPYHEMFATSVV